MISEIQPGSYVSTKDVRDAETTVRTTRETDEIARAIAQASRISKAVLYRKWIEEAMEQELRELEAKGRIKTMSV